MREVAFEIPPDARNVRQIPGFSVPAPQPRKNADDLGIALRPENRIGNGEALRVEIRLELGDLPAIVRQHLPLERSGDLKTRILKQGHQIESPWPLHSILEVEHTHMLQIPSIGPPHQVRRMEIAQHPSLRLLQHTIELRGPQPAE